MNDDEGDDLDEEERQALHRALEQAAKEAEAGRMRPAEDVLRDPRNRS